MILRINNKKFEYFSEYSIDLRFASIANSFSFKGLADFLPEILTYPNVQIFDDDELLLTGTAINSAKIESKTPELVSVSGYSKAGVLQDCTIKGSLQFNNLTIEEIINKVLKPFNVSYVSEVPLTRKLEKSSADVTETAFSYIKSLLSQQGIFITNNEKGEIVFAEVKETKPVKSINDNSGTLNMNLSVNGQSMHSEITVVKQATRNNPDAGEFTIQNPFVSVYRPTTKILNSGSLFDVENAARNELSSELTNIVLTIQALEIIKPGNFIEVQSDELNIQKSTWFVETTNIRGTKSSDIYTMTCVPKEVYI